MISSVNPFYHAFKQASDLVARFLRHRDDPAPDPDAVFP